MRRRIVIRHRGRPAGYCLPRADARERLDGDAVLLRLSLGAEMRRLHAVHARMHLYAVWAGWAVDSLPAM